MANNNFFRYLENLKIQATCALAQTVSIGDLVGLVSNTIEKASDITWNATTAGTQEDFHDAFLGVSEQASAATDSDAIRVASGGVYEFPCASASFEVGELVGPAKASGNALEDQKVVKVAEEKLAIGRVVLQTSSETTVLVKIFSTIIDGGPQPLV